MSEGHRILLHDHQAQAGVGHQLDNQPAGAGLRADTRERLCIVGSWMSEGHRIPLHSHQAQARAAS